MKKVEKPEKTIICRFDGANVGTVYAGGMTNLENVNDVIDWHTEEDSGNQYLYLNEIAEQLMDTYYLVTVVEEGPLSGRIYQRGNYIGGDWWEIGELAGYA